MTVNLRRYKDPDIQHYKNLYEEHRRTMNPQLPEWTGANEEELFHKLNTAFMPQDPESEYFDSDYSISESDYEPDYAPDPPEYDSETDPDDYNDDLINYY